MFFGWDWTRSTMGENWEAFWSHGASSTYETFGICAKRYYHCTFERRSVVGTPKTTHLTPNGKHLSDSVSSNVLTLAHHHIGKRIVLVVGVQAVIPYTINARRLCCLYAVGGVLNHHTFAGLAESRHGSCFKNLGMRFGLLQVGTAYLRNKILIEVKTFKDVMYVLHRCRRRQYQ